MYFSKNKKLNGVLNEILEDLEELGAEEVRRYKKTFDNVVDYNIVSYGTLLCYYSQVRDFYKRHGYKIAEQWSDSELWELYKRQVGHVAYKAF